MLKAILFLMVAGVIIGVLVGHALDAADRGDMGGMLGLGVVFALGVALMARKGMK